MRKPGKPSSRGIPGFCEFECAGFDEVERMGASTEAGASAPRSEFPNLGNQKTTATE